MKQYFITGDTHGKNYQRICQMIEQYSCSPKNSSLIILGDAGFNFWLDKKEQKWKKRVNDLGYSIYCVRGNHEEHPKNLPNIQEIWDAEIQGWIYTQPDFPNLKYLIDGNTYYFNSHSAIVFGGAYSVDKYYRLMQATLNRTDDWTGWFPDEQLTQQEMLDINNKVINHHYDLVLSHTCPFDWRPTDLFLPGIDQSTVDNTMEIWMNDLKDKFSWNNWFWGHFHTNKDYYDGRYMLFENIYNLEDLIND